MRKFSSIFLILMNISLMGVSQGGKASNELKPFYSTYVYKKINYRWSADLYALAAMKSMSHDFWLTQFDLGANYRLNRFYTLSFGYAISLYNYSAWWEDHYPQKPNFLNTVTFHTLDLAIARNDNLGSKFRLTNKIIAQQYFPKFEKYQTRLQYYIKVRYRKSDLPLALKPFVQGSLYYYLNGAPINYYDEDLNLIEVSAPNGFHRYRIKAGTSFRPVASNKQLSFTLYFGINREFNINGFGKDINVPTPSISGNRIFTSYQFNNYNILGAQVNYIF